MPSAITSSASTTPPPVTTYVARLGLTNERPVEERVFVPLRHATLPFHGLDPPAA